MLASLSDCGRVYLRYMTQAAGLHAAQQPFAQLHCSLVVVCLTPSTGHSGTSMRNANRILAAGELRSRRKTACLTMPSCSNSTLSLGPHLLRHGAVPALVCKRHQLGMPRIRRKLQPLQLTIVRLSLNPCHAPNRTACFPVNRHHVSRHACHGLVARHAARLHVIAMCAKAS